MVDLLTGAALFVGTVSLVVLAGSMSVIAYTRYRRYLLDSPPGLGRQRLQAYNEIMTQVTRLNRTVVELEDSDDLHKEYEKLFLQENSPLNDQVEDVNEALYGSYYLIEDDVRDAVSDYVNYITTYHERGLNAGRVLSLSGQITKTMRGNLDLPDIFPEENKHEQEEPLQPNNN